MESTLPQASPPGPDDGLDDAGTRIGHALRGPLPWVGVFIVAALVVGAIIRPFAAGTVAGDAAASVLYWDRIVSGRHLEAFVNSTPKPLMTLVYGIPYQLTGDWRSVSLLSIIAAASAVTLGARLAFRIAGGIAALLAGVVLLGSSILLVEVSWAYGYPWMVALLAAAGLALTASAPRYGAAGTLLLLSALIRQESFLVLAAATVAIGYLALRHRMPRRAPLVLIGWAAIPIMLVHDVLLTGDPLYWMKVSGIYADGIKTRTPREVAESLVRILRAHPLLSVAAAVGIAGAWFSERGRVISIGLVALGAGTAALVLAVAVMDRQTISHYYDPIWLVMGFSAALGAGYAAAAVGAGWSERVVPAVAARGRSIPSALPMAVIVIAAGIVGLLAIRPLLLDGGTIAYIDERRAIAQSADEAVPVLAGLATRLDTAEPPVGPLVRPAWGNYQVLIPRAVRYRLALDLGLPITMIGPITPDRRTKETLRPGVVVYHDELADGKTGAVTRFEGPTPMQADGVTFDLVANDPETSWIWQGRP